MSCRRRAALQFAAGLLLFLQVTTARAATITFEGLSDSTIVTSQYPDLTFSNAIILSSGVSLNELEFPPESGVNVVSDNGGPISISFASPILSFSARFTYIEPLTLAAFDASATLVDSTISAFSSNDALFGDPGSSPNELLQLSYAGGISEVTISGDPLGGSFVMDDVTYETAPAVASEPSSFSTLFSGLAALLVIRRFARS